MKIDPHRNKDRYLRWKRNAQAEAAGISPANFEIIMRFLSDMEQGLNVGTGSRKGPRSYAGERGRESY
jgi:hypothetical protein